MLFDQSANKQISFIGNKDKQKKNNNENPNMRNEIILNQNIKSEKDDNSNNSTYINYRNNFKNKEKKKFKTFQRSSSTYNVQFSNNYKVLNNTNENKNEIKFNNPRRSHSNIRYSEGYSNNLCQNKKNFLTTFNSNFSQKELKSNLSKYKYHKNNKIYILDNIIENLSFSRYHLGIILICSFKQLMDGYLQFFLTKISILTYKNYNWTKGQNLTFIIAQQIFLGIGAVFSTNTRSVHWDVKSNVLINFIGSLSLLLNHFYIDSATFCCLFLIYSICHGFISNICTNYLIELINMKFRNFFYLFISGFKIFGTFISIFFILIFNGENFNNNGDFSILSVGLTVGEFILSVILFLNNDSLCVLFYTDDISLLYDYLVEMRFLDEFTGVKYFDVDLHKKNFVIKLDNDQIDINLDIYDINEFVKNNDNRENNQFISKKKKIKENYALSKFDNRVQTLKEDDIQNIQYVKVPNRLTSNLNLDINQLKSLLFYKLNLFFYFIK